MSATDTITISREELEKFIVEMDAVAGVEIILAGNTETALVDHIYSVLEDFERTTLGGPAPDELHTRAGIRSREIFREIDAEAVAS